MHTGPAAEAVRLLSRRSVLQLLGRCLAACVCFSLTSCPRVLARHHSSQLCPPLPALLVCCVALVLCCALQRRPGSVCRVRGRALLPQRRAHSCSAGAGGSHAEVGCDANTGLCEGRTHRWVGLSAAHTELCCTGCAVSIDHRRCVGSAGTRTEASSCQRSGCAQQLRQPVVDSVSSSHGLWCHSCLMRLSGPQL